MVVVTADQCQTRHFLEIAVEGTNITDHRGQRAYSLQAAAKLSSHPVYSVRCTQNAMTLPHFTPCLASWSQTCKTAQRLSLVMCFYCQQIPCADPKQQCIDPANIKVLCVSKSSYILCLCAVHISMSSVV